MDTTYNKSVRVLLEMVFHVVSIEPNTGENVFEFCSVAWAFPYHV
jgi:hypothetical protein